MMNVIEFNMGMSYIFIMVLRKIVMNSNIV